MKKEWNTWLAVAVVSAIAIGGLAMAAPDASASEMMSAASPAVATAVTTTPTATSPTDVPVATSTTPPVATGTPGGEAAGWQIKPDHTIYYINADGKRLTGTQQIENVWYLFAADGTLQTGWQTVSGLRYYYDAQTGKPQFGWLTYNDERYYVDKVKGKLTGWATVTDGAEPLHCYFDRNGVLQTGFFRTEKSDALYYATESGGIYSDGIYWIGEMPYWFYSDGALHTGWQTIDGIRRYYDPQTGLASVGWVVWNEQYYYVFQETGKQKGFTEIDGEYYPFSEMNGSVVEGHCTMPDETIRYYHRDGSYQKGWLHTDDGTYLFDQEGAMQISWQELGNNIYYFHSDGRMAVGFTKIDNSIYFFSDQGIQQFGLQLIQGKRYYFDFDAGKMHSGWITLENATYFFDQSGAAVTGWMTDGGKTYYFSADGKRQIGWQTIRGKRYCFDGNGVMVTGWQNAADGNRYYFGADGVMRTGWQTISGDSYYFSEKGACAFGVTILNQQRYYFDESTGKLLRNQTKNGITTNASGIVTKVLLGTPYLSQVGYPTGCESASAVMLLLNAGYQTSIGNFIDNALDIGYLYYQNGYLYGPDPNQAFIGDPRSSHGYGCYAPVITNALNRILNQNHTAKNITGASFSSLLTNYIDKGTPVAVWATINMIATEPGTQWIVPETGAWFTWKKHEHCLVLVGYDDQYYYMNDPYKNNGLRAYSRAVVEARYAALGSQAVVITNT